MKTAYFHNFTNEPFVGTWNGRSKTFAPGSKRLMEDWLAAHFATHLANRELIKQGEFTSTSPKKPAEVPKFKELFDMACIVVEDSFDDDENEIQMDILNDKSNQRPRAEVNTRSSEPQIIGPDVNDSDDDSFED